MIGLYYCPKPRKVELFWPQKLCFCGDRGTSRRRVT